VSSVVDGTAEVFRQLAEQSATTADSMVGDGERIREAFGPPDFTPWERMMHQINQWGNTIYQIVLFVVKGVGQLLAGLAVFIVNDLIKNVLEALYEFAAALTTFLLDFDLDELGKHIRGMGKELNDVFVEGDASFLAMTNAMGKAWKDMVAGFDFRTIEQMAVDDAFERARKEAEGEREEPSVTPSTVHTPKDVTIAGLTLSDDALKKAERQREMMIDAQVEAYRELLSDQTKTRDELLTIWDGYEQARMEQIQLETKALMELGVPIDVLSQLIPQRMNELNMEQRDLFGDQMEWLREWANEAANIMHSSFSEFFFDTMKGEWSSLLDMFKNLWDSFLRAIADQAAAELTNFFDVGSMFGSNGGKGGGGFSLGNLVPFLQTGGVVTQPTLAVVGDVPEAIIPLSKLNDQRFVEGMSGNTGTSEINLSFQVNTPDIESFKRSQMQLMAQAQTALKLAQRNL
jgi:hypothetical protein